MHGEKYIKMNYKLCANTNWINKLKVAILNQNEEDAILLLDSIPIFNNTNDLITTRALISELLCMLHKNKNNLAHDMYRIKQVKTFLET